MTKENDETIEMDISSEEVRNLLEPSEKKPEEERGEDPKE